MKNILFIILMIFCINASAENYTKRINWFDGEDSITIKVLFTNRPTNESEFSQAILEFNNIKHKYVDEKYYFDSVIDALIRQSKETNPKDRFYDTLNYCNIILQNNFEKRNCDFSGVLSECYRRDFNQK